MKAATKVLGLVAAIVPGALCVKLWETPGDLPNDIPASCRVTLIGEIECSRLVRPNELQIFGSLTEAFLTEHCQQSCVDSLKDFADQVDQRCGWESHNWGAGMTGSGNDVVQPLVWAQDVACLQDRKTGAYCIPALAGGGNITQCDDCALQYMAGFINVEYAPDIMSPEKFSAVLELCGADPKDYPAETRTYGDPTGPGPTESPVPDGTPLGCYGEEYIVESGDTCRSIADAHSLAYHRFLADNSLDPECQTLEEGAAVCISLSCKLQEIQAGQTCDGILRDKAFTIVELQAWNPIIYRDCSNLPLLEGFSICISPPGTDEYDVDIGITFTDPTMEPTGSWIPAPTTGRDAGNDTILTGIPEPPTESGTVDDSRGEEYAAVVTNCPVTNDMLAEGFVWGMFDEECSSMVEPYCKLPSSGAEYPPTTTFPASCLPSVILGLA